jgi:pimeloyl-ACP methyl ester carboxylesterase
LAPVVLTTIYHFGIDEPGGEASPVLSTTEHHFDRPERPLVVLVHGAMDRSRSFRRVVDHLSDLRVVTYDRRGYGDSIDATPPSGLQDHTTDLLDVIGNRRATVVAHSVAGHIAVLAAIEDPDRIASIGLWEPAAPWMDFWPEKARQSVARIAAAPDAGDVAERGVIAMVGEEAWNRLSEAARQQRRAEGTAFVLDMVTGMTPPYDWAHLGVPCTIGYGTSWPHVKTSPQIAGTLDCPTFTIEGASHVAHVTHPLEFAEFVRRAVASASA